ncbi:MAG: YjfB family protein [Lachnospiraceae bacterium]|nr:YjfB family protein [Lachnospiraceae bacterium]
MDIPALSMSMSQAKLGTALGTKVLAMNLDMMNNVGDALSKTMDAMPSPSLESLANPGTVGTTIDIAV